MEGHIKGSWGSYPSIHNFGHKAIIDLLKSEVIVQEKLDGSQFSFGWFPNSEPGLELRIKSKSAIIVPDAPPKMFHAAVDTVKDLCTKGLLHAGWTYRGEAFAKPHHNALAYERVPKGNIILFDVNDGEESYLPYEKVVEVGNELGLEVVSLIYQGMIETIEFFRSLLDTVSVLGGQKIEGVVVKPKNYDLYGTDHKVLMGKYVSEAFREVHKKTWGEGNPKGGDILQILGSKYCNQARWQKARIHLQEIGQIENSPRDIGPLIKAVPPDIRKECEDEIKEELFKWAWPHISRMSTNGLPQWYKDLLLYEAFEQDAHKELITKPEEMDELGTIVDGSIVDSAEPVARVATDFGLA